ncbi:MAG: hypothetical protein AAGG11_22200 [Pseudomonadota bacterium]
MTTIRLLMLAALWPAALAQAGAGPCSAPRYAEFDFWIGSWEVRSPGGELQGTNRISREEGNCLIVERWQSVTGGTGQSYNYFNPGDQHWHQLWVSQDAIIRYQGGLTEQGAMRLEGHIVYQADGRRAEFRGVWTPRDDGSVLQAFEEKDTATGQWQDWFTGIYRRSSGE